MTATTRTMVSISSNSTSLTDARIVVVRSVITSTLMPCGSDALICGSSAWTVSTTLMMLVPGLALNVQDDRPIGVHPRRQLGVLDAVDDGGDVGDADGRAVAVGDDDRPVLRAGLELIVVVDRPRLIGAVEVSLRLIDVGAGERRPQRLQAQAVRGERGRIGPDAHRRTLAAADAHEADALQLRDALRHAGFGQLLDLRQRHRGRGERERQDRRIGGIGLAVDRRHRQVLRAAGSAPR